MARDGSGTYNRPVADYVYDTVISETDVNTEMDQIATALTDSLAKNGETNPTANLPMATYRHTGVGNASARSDYASADDVQDSTLVWCGTAGGTKNALTLTPSPAIAAYATGQRFAFKAGSTASDDAVTVAISGLTTKAAELDDAALSATRIIEANKYYEVLYDGTALQISQISQSLIPGIDVQTYDADNALLDTKQAWTNQQYFTPVTNDTSSSGLVTFDFSAHGNYVEFTLTENLTGITLTGLNSGGTYKIRLKQHASAAKTVTGWPAAVQWLDGVEGVMTTTVGGYTMITIEAGATDHLAVSADYE